MVIPAASGGVWLKRVWVAPETGCLVCVRDSGWEGLRWLGDWRWSTEAGAEAGAEARAEIEGEGCGAPLAFASVTTSSVSVADGVGVDFFGKRLCCAILRTSLHS